ncbi:MAG: MFS transporter [Bacteroidota bacterium]
MFHSLRAFFRHPQSLSLGLLFAILAILFSSWVTRLPEIQEQLILSKSQLGFSLLGMSIGGLVITPLSALLMLYTRIRRGSVLSSLLYCFSFLLPVAAYNFHWLFVAMLIVGVTNGFMQFVVNSAAAAVEKEQRRHLMSTCHGMFSAGGLIGAGSTSVLASLGVSATTHLTLLCLLMAVLTWLLRPIIYTYPDESDTTSRLSLPGRPVLGLVAMSFFVMMAEGVVMDWSSVYLKNTLNSGAFLSGFGYFGFSLTMALGRLSGAGLIARWGAPRLVRLGCVLGVLGLSTAAFFTEPLVVIAGFSLVGLGFSCIAPILFSAAAATPGVHPSSGIAAIATAITVGIMAGRPIVGLIADDYGLAAGFWLAAGVTLLASFLSVVVKIKH